MSRALLFPGQGAQTVGMGKDLYEAWPAVRELYDEADALVDFDLKRISFEGPEGELTRTDVSQPAIVVASLAALRALESELGGPIPGVIAACGMSLGEYTALAWSGALSLGDALHLVIQRGRFMQDCCEATPSGMTSVMGLDRAGCEAVLAEAGEGDKVGVANDNSARQVVLSGEQEALDRVAAKAKEAGARRLFPLTVAGAYHSKLMAPAGERLADELARVKITAPRVPVIANVLAAAYGSESAVDVGGEIAARLVEQVSGTVRWRESMSRLSELGVTEAVELGPGGVLKGLMRQNVRAITTHSAMTADEVRAVAVLLAGDQGENS